MSLGEGRSANPVRGETSLLVDGRALIIRPTFSALVAAEEELGPLFALVEQAGNGQLALHQIVTLFWHCVTPSGCVTREQVGDAVVAMGLAASARPLRSLLGQILQGSG